MNSPSPVDPLNVWHYKPWWCQPWSILLTGISLIGGSWGMFHRLWLTLLVGVPIALWMGFFLLVYPKLFRQMQANAQDDEAVEHQSPN
jgi:hypothetical protein